MYCNNCGFARNGEDAACPSCGFGEIQEPHISDITSGSVVTCEICGAMNRDGSNFCRLCGKKLNAAVIQSIASAVLGNSIYAEDIARAKSSAYNDKIDTARGDEGYADKTVPDAVPLEESFARESLLEKLDRMENELKLSLQKEEETLETAAEGPDELDAHEETLNNIAYTLDSLITDLLEAEVREYAFPDFIHSDEAGFPLKDASPAVGTLYKGRNIQEILVLMALIAAIFLVGLSFGLWGSYFFGLM
jgi:hypothetical protein